MRFILLIVFIGFFLKPTFSQLNPQVIDATLDQFFEYIESIDNEIIIDARPEIANEKNGFSGALCISTKAKLFEFMKEIDKNIPVLVYCTEGVRSVKVSNLLVENGFETVINLNDGVRKHKKKIRKFNSKIKKQ